MVELVEYNKSIKDEVFRFTSKCFTELGKSFEPEGRHEFYNHIEEHFEGFWCLVDQNIVKGTAAIARLDDTTAELKALYVDASLRGQGWGYKLLDHAVKFAKAAGFGRVVLDSMSKYESAARLYRRYGFTDTARYNDNQYADVFMELILEETHD